MLRRIIRIVFVVHTLIAVHAQSRVPGPAEISGASHPELIPDREALMILLLKMSDAPTAMPAGTREKFLKEGGLTSAEAQSVVKAANQFRAIYNSVFQGMKQAKQANGAKPLTAQVRGQLDALVAQGWAAVEDSRTSLDLELGPGGAARLRQLIHNKVKPTMVFVPGR